MDMIRVFEKGMQARFLPVVGDISQPLVEGALRLFSQANAPDGIFVSSPGGELDCFSVLAPQIERRELLTLAGDVRSSAIILFLLGRTRYALPDSTFFFHEVRVLVSGGEISLQEAEGALAYDKWMTAQDREFLEDWRRQMKQAERWFIQFMERTTGVPAHTFLKLMRSEATLTAKEAVQYGIVHRILPTASLYYPGDTGRKHPSLRHLH